MKKIYFIVFLSIFLMSGCGNFFEFSKPKKPQKKLPVKVVEVIEENPTTVNTVGQSPIIETNEKTKVKKPALKPEPFSVESGEEDPEVLGGQGILKEKLEKLKAKKSDTNSTKKI